MTHITIIGAGAYGSKIAGKYKKIESVNIKAVVSPHKPTAEVFLDIPHFTSAAEWKKEFGVPQNDEVFELCVHPPLLIQLMNDFVKIGARNFILPKPIALNGKDLSHIQQLKIRHRLRILVASQWHYSKIVARSKTFVEQNRNRISSISINFSRPFGLDKRPGYTPISAFLPHALQIIHDLGFNLQAKELAIEQISNKKIRVRYQRLPLIRIESNLGSKSRKETLEIFLKGNSSPSLVADFTLIAGHSRISQYPSITIGRKRTEVREDVLATMAEMEVRYFSHKKLNSSILTLSKYLPVAKGVVWIGQQSEQVVGVIGGGIFGVLSALEIAKKGHSVILFEKDKEIITGASLVNQCRVHMGYHYPRDEDTARASRTATEPFIKMFNPAVVKRFKNYYFVAKEGSLTSPENFLAFCKELDLPYKVEWPRGTHLAKNKIGVSVRVPELIFDANKIRGILEKKLALSKIVTVLRSTEVTGIHKREDGKFDVQYTTGGKDEIMHCKAIVNAAYSAANQINAMAGLPIEHYQYELCEVPVVMAPWKGIGWSIIDGPFFGAMPFGFAKEYLYYDVELSVLERFVGALPSFKRSVEYYDQNKRRLKRFQAYINKWKPWVKEVVASKSLYSMYVVRAVLPKKEKTDTRPTMIHELSKGFWQLFSGKITTSVPKSIELAARVEDFLKGRN